MHPDQSTPRRKTPLEPEGVEVDSCTLDLRFRLLGQTPFFEGLQNTDITDINRSFHERGFAAGEAIYHAGDPAVRLYVVAAGKVKLLRHTLAGQDVLLDILGQGEFFGTLSTLGEPEYSDTALAQTDGCALWVDAEAFQAILRRYPPVALSVLDIMAVRLRAAHDAIRQLSAAPVESRIASTLLKLAAKLGRPTSAAFSSGPPSHARTSPACPAPPSRPPAASSASSARTASSTVAANGSRSSTERSWKR